MTMARHYRDVPDRAIPPVALRVDIACTPEDNDTFYPEDHNLSDVPAKRICRRCPHEADCLAWALSTRQRSGVWGGKNPREREAIIKGIKSTTRTPS